MKYIIYLMTLIVFASFVSADITGSEVMTRNVPSSSTGSFQLTYQVSGASGSWGASIEDSISGGCTFPSGSTTYKSVMLSEDGMSKTITINAPSSDTTCTFSGDYKFGELPVVDFTNSVVTIVSGGGTTTTQQTTSSTVATTTTVHDPTCIDFGGSFYSSPCSQLGMTEYQTYDTPAGKYCCVHASQGACEIYETREGGECVTAGWVYVVFGFVGLMILLKSM